MKKTLFVVSGEASGDAHLSKVLGALLGEHPELAVQGLAGEHSIAALKEAGVDSSQLEDWVEDAAVVGLTEVLKHYQYFRKKFDQTIERIRVGQCDMVLLVDYPGFNLRLAKAIRQHCLKTKIVYYISPQVWAWNQKRIAQMARILDKMLCIFPFEEPLYEASGLPTAFVGHPMVEELEALRAAAPERDEHLIALLPGSRTREIERIFPLLLESAQHVQEQLASVDSKIHFATAGRSDKAVALLQSIARSHSNLPLSIERGSARALMQRAQIGVVASGTATLEAAYLGLPHALVYRVAWPTYLFARMVIKVDYLGIVNVLAKREVIKEFIQADATLEALSAHMQHLFTDERARESLQEELFEVTSKLKGKQVELRAASEISQLLYASK